MEVVIQGNKQPHQSFLQAETASTTTKTLESQISIAGLTPRSQMILGLKLVAQLPAFALF